MLGRRARCVLGGLLAFALGELVLGCAPSPPPPNVLFIVLDTFRADRLATYGGRRGLTPFLDELATRGAVFARSYAASSWTCPSVASLLTSRHPLQHGVRDFDSVLGEGEVTLAEALRPLGYETAGFSANPLLDARRGYGQGFDTWRTYRLGTEGASKVRGAQLRSEALAWLDARSRDEPARPVFLYLQYMDTHSAYSPPSALRQRFAPDADRDEIAALNARLHRRHDPTRFAGFTPAEVALLRALYDGESTALDTELRRLFGNLTKRGFLDHAYVVITADHGEEFREHEVMMHGHSLYEAVVRVPLVVIGPGIPPGRRIASPVSGLDVGPTLLALLGAPREPAFEGRSLLAALTGAGDAAPGDVLLELPRRDRPSEIQLHELALLEGSKKLLVDAAGGAALYDLARDPEERAPEASDPELAARLAAERAQLATRAAASEARAPIDAQTLEQLRALGYAEDVPPARDAGR